MRIDAFDYDLPAEQIAQHPTVDREAARLLVMARGGSEGADDTTLEHRTITELADLIPEGSLVVLNDTRVISARLRGVKVTGGKVEIFLVRKLGTRRVDGTEVEVWRAMGKGGKALKFGSDIEVGTLRIHLLGRADDGLLEVGLSVRSGDSVDDAIAREGHVPLPPYIKRDDAVDDRERYQTVFARVDGAIAAPTAGLHLTRALLGRLAVRGCEVANVTLHVGLGTFQPVSVEDLDDHPMHSERYEVSRATATAIARARDRGAKVFAVGTTVVRALESAHDPDRDGLVCAGAGDTSLLIQPGYRFRVVDMLLTNFHVPKSTLLALTCAFGGTERVMAAYRTAVLEKYRFFSYGDAMLLSRAETEKAS